MFGMLKINASFFFKEDMNRMEIGWRLITILQDQMPRMPERDRLQSLDAL